MREHGVHDFVQGVEASAVGIEGGDVDVAAFEFVAAMLVVKMAVSGIAQRRGLASVSVNFEVNASAEVHLLNDIVIAAMLSNCCVSTTEMQRNREGQLVTGTSAVAPVSKSDTKSDKTTFLLPQLGFSQAFGIGVPLSRNSVSFACRCCSQWKVSLNSSYTRLVKSAGRALACAMLLVLSLHGYNYYLQFKAERMVRAVMALRTGKASLDDAVAVANEFGLQRTSENDQACDTHSECSWRGQIANPLPLDYSFVRYLGVHYWSIAASIAVKDDHVQGTHTGLLVRSPGPEGDLVADINSDTVFRNRRAFLPFARVTYPYNPALNLCWHFFVNTGPSPASAVQLPELDINFNCLAGLRACKRMSDLMPSAWDDYTRIEKKEVDWSAMEKEVRSDVRCHLGDSSGLQRR
ncbi:MAG: hypothetical protein JWO13_3273 [Acidobacteriales bacterium]|nr:hypothetical protein [Terriglobales bacterium]